MALLALREATLNYETLGEGEAVVLVHGLGANLAFWYLRIARVLASRGYHVIVYDLRGHGRSSTPTHGYSLRIMRGDLHALIEHLGVSRMHLVGHSFGARVALAYAVHHPARVATLTLADVPLRCMQPPMRLADWPHWPRWKAALKQQGVESLPNDDEIIDFRMLQHFSRLPELGVTTHRPSPRNRQPRRRTGEHRHFLLAPDTARELDDEEELSLPSLQAMTVPTQAMYGEHTHCLATGERLRETLPHCNLVVVPGAGHFHPAVRPRYFVARLLGFLRRHPIAASDARH